MATPFYTCTLKEVKHSQARKIRLAEGTRVIPTHWFKNKPKVQVVELPETTVAIGKGAFEGCVNLVHVDWPGVTHMGDGAFSGCYKLRRARLPQGMTQVRQGVFEDCYGLEAVTLPPALESLGDAAFKRCESLKRIAIPQGITALPPEAFAHCKHLGRVDLPDGLEIIGTRACEMGIDGLLQEVSGKFVIILYL